MNLRNDFRRIEKKYKIVLFLLSCFIVISGFSVSLSILISVENTYVDYESSNIQSIDSSISRIDDGPGTIWTTLDDCGEEQQNVNLYCSGDTVYINGANYNPNIELDWFIKGKADSCDAYIKVAYGTHNSGNDGSFCFAAYTIENDDCGGYRVNVDEKKDNFAVISCNYPPVVSDIPDQTVAEGVGFATINLDDYVEDNEDPDTAISWSYSGDSELSVDITARVATITPLDENWNGAETITFTAEDSGGLTDFDDAMFTVTAVNDPPVVSDIPDQTVAEGDNFVTISLDDYVDDVDNTDVEMTWSYSGNSDLSVDITARVATITIPDPNWYGSEMITFTATDPGFSFDSDSAIFSVSSENDPPVVTNIPDQTIGEGQIFSTIYLDDYVSDIEDPDENIQWTFIGNIDISVDITDRIVTITAPGINWYGYETITFIAEDTGRLMDSDDATFTIFAINDPPLVDDIPDQTLNEGEIFTTISLDDYVSDIDNQDAEITWNYSGNIDLTVTITTNRVATIGIPGLDWFGSETILFRATDFDGLWDEDEATFTITGENDPPVVSDIPDQTIPEGGTFSTVSLDDYVADVEDADEEIIWTYTGNTDLLIAIDTNRIATINTPGPEWNGSETITFTAEDTGGLTDNDDATFMVSSVNDPPFAPYDPRPENGTTGTNLSVILMVNASDIDGDILNVSFYDADDDGLIGFDGDVPSGTNASVLWSGLSYQIKYSWYALANDSEYTNTSKIWNFTTKSRPTSGFTNAPPIADASLSDTTGFVGEAITFDGSQSEDFDGSIVNFTWDFDDGVQGFGKKTTHIYNENGTYQVILTVFDDFGASDTDIVNVVILKGNYPPTTPSIEGPTSGHKNRSYEFSAVSFDFDNDTIRYVFDWGDGNSTTTDYLPNGTAIFTNYTWTHYGEYIVTVQAFDNKTGSGIAEHTILIDVLPIDDVIKGYLVDEDSEDTYDIFDNFDTQNKTKVLKENQTYLIDIEGDGKWDYAFNLRKGVSPYHQYLYDKYYEKLSNDTPGFETLTLLAVIAIVFLVFRRKRRN